MYKLNFHLRPDLMFFYVAAFVAADRKVGFLHFERFIVNGLLLKIDLRNIFGILSGWYGIVS